RTTARETLVPVDVVVGDEAVGGRAPGHHRRHPRSRRHLEGPDARRLEQRRALRAFARRPRAGARLPDDLLRRTPHYGNRTRLACLAIIDDTPRSAATAGLRPPPGSGTDSTALVDP